jgi:2',3'-cyclic-nucleotide 2'-phosphodiesterase (5'-nucleotidase family)
MFRISLIQQDWNGGFQMKARLLVLLVIVALLIPAIPSVAAPPVSTGGPQAAAVPEDLVQEMTFAVAEDTYVSAYAPTTNYGAKSEMYLRSGGIKGALLKFDVSAIPAGATVLGAQLMEYGRTDVGSPVDHLFTVAAFEVYRDWNQAEVTWLNATAGDMWGLPGLGDTVSDRAATPEDTFSVPGNLPASDDPKGVLSIPSMVQDWVADPAMNHGVLLELGATISMEIAVASSDYWDASLHPELKVFYTTYDVADMGKMDFNASADTWISAYAPATNYEGTDRIKVRTGGEFETLVKFGLNGAAAAAPPEGAVVAKATLRLYQLGLPHQNNVAKITDASKALAPAAKAKNKAAPNSIGAAGGLYCSPDMYEPDNSMEEARWFAVNGQPETHGFAPCQDSDWVKFEARAGDSFMIDTLRLGQWYDTILYLYDANGTELASDDDSGQGLASAISWTAPADGVYYVKAVEYPTDCPPYSTWYECASGSYDLRIRTLGLHVYKALKDWAAGEATWQQPSVAEAWDTAGGFGPGDRQVPALDTVPLAEPYVAGWVELDVTQAVRDWTMDMTAAEDNFGFLLEAASDASTEYTFASMEYADATKRPMLEVVYVVKPPDITLNFVDTNDFHGALIGATHSYSHGDIVGGLAWLGGYYDILRGLNPGGVVALDVGDMMQGTLDSNYFNGESTVAGFNALGVEASALGNHEFDWGIDVLEERMAQADFPWLSSNIRYKDSGERPSWAHPYAFIEHKGIKIGVIGASLPSTGLITNPSITGNLDFTNPATEINALVDEVWAQGANFVVVIAHLGGFSPDYGEAAELANALNPAKVQLLFTGHTHSNISTVINDIPVVQAYSSGTAFGRVDYTFDAWTLAPTGFEMKGVLTTYATWYGAPLIYEGQELQEDAAVAAAIQPYLDEVATLKNTVIGETLVPLTRDSQYESSMGDFVADAMRAYDDTIDFAMTNSGGLRADLDAGPITFGALFNVTPFGNTLVKVFLTGEQVRATLEDGVSGRHGLVQESGLQFTFDYDQPIGSRIVGDIIDLNTGLPIDPAATYVVIVNNFMADGGDEYGTLPLAPQELTYVVDIEHLVSYVETHSPISEPVGGRMTALGTP